MTYKYDVAPSWATGPMTYEIDHIASGGLKFRILDIPGFPEDIRGRSQTLFLTRLDGRDRYITSVSNPEDRLNEGTLYIWGSEPTQDREYTRIRTSVGLINQFIAAYNKAVRNKLNGFDHVDSFSINGEKSPHKNKVPDINDVYYYADNGIICHDLWLYRDVDIERWKSQKLARGPRGIKV